MFDIKGKSAIVTGGTSGIGLSTAQALLAKGAKVVVAGRNPQRGEKAVEELSKTSPEVAFCQTDTSDEKSVKDLVDFAVERFGSLDIMVNNAGTGAMATVDEMTGEDWRKVIDINLTGVFYGIKYAAIQMKKQGHGGAIVSTSSIEGAVGDPLIPSYCAAKGGVNLLTKSSALALAKDGIRVSTVNPGYVDTPLVSAELIGQERHDALLAMHPLGRFAKPEEIAHAVVFLVENEFVTGTQLYVDGGYTAQ
ncbi:MAG: SDR family NAD(P)-dependent oxidoreductase [Parafannyhessea sp.]|uniref:SDR family NAD(P)-dependent oxidoreductase n=1 Tax=Parafannyhessea sp. TaxID=2847324 RepID=UPI003F08219D